MTKPTKIIKFVIIFLEQYVNSKNHLDKLYIFLHRALDYSNFVSRRTYISPKILGKWKELSIEGTDRVRKICVMKKTMLLYLQVKDLFVFMKQLIMFLAQRF